MAVLKILPQFQNDEERNLVALGIGLTLLFGGYLSFIPPMVVYFGLSDKLSESGKLIMRQFINFMISVAILMIILTITVIGVFLVPIVGVCALILVIVNLLAVLNKSQLTIPILYEFLKPAVAQNQPVEQNNEQNNENP